MSVADLAQALASALRDHMRDAAREVLAEERNAAPDRLLRVRERAELAGQAESTWRQAIAEGRVDGVVRLGRSVRLRADSVIRPRRSTSTAEDRAMQIARGAR